MQEFASHKVRAGLFRGGCSARLSQGGMSIKIFGTREAVLGIVPHDLPPLAHSIFDRYAPSKGKLTDPRDMDIIARMESVARLFFPPLEVGWDKHYPYRGGLGPGTGRRVNPDGSSQEGEWLNLGEVWAHGCHQRAVMHGRGKSTWAHGDVYVGEHRSGQPYGEGVMTYSDGSVYEGRYLEGLRHGQGKETSSDGTVIEGTYRSGRLHGNGKVLYPDGAAFEGKFRDGKMNGHGKYTYPDGAVYEGEFQDNGRHGHGSYTFPDGQVYVSTFTSNKGTGEDVWWSADRVKAWRLYDGNKDDEISLAEAAVIAARLPRPQTHTCAIRE